MKNIFQDLKRKDHKRYLGGLDLFKYIGPGLLVTVGFIDPGNWASNFAAGSEFGYSLLWVVTLSTIMLIVLQHNVAHLGIVTGLCLSEAATKYTPQWVSRPILGTAVLASISTSLAEILGGAIALEMLLDIPIIWGAVLTTLFVSIMLFTNSYKKIERSIIAFVSVIGLSFIYELFLVDIDWPAATVGWVTPAFPKGSMLIIMSVLGAVVMPHNLFLHSEVIQSHEYNKKDDASIKKVLKYELFDTLFSMIVGWAINSAMILLAAATFFKSGIQVEELQQAQSLLEPLLGSNAAIVLLEQVQEMGVKVCYVTLHVGLGTFRPVKEDTIEGHEMHSEYCVIPQETADLINETKRSGGRVICVGTTSCRTLESATDENGILKAGSGWTEIFIYPGYHFKIMDALITNFHLPESTLLMLVSAFADKETIMKAYEEAVRERYRFFSFGDAMFIK